MFVQLLPPGSHISEELTAGDLEFEVRSDPNPVLVRILDQDNFTRFEAGEDYTYFGPDLASKDHEFEESLEEGKAWHLVVLNESDEPVAVGTESYLDDDDAEEEEEGGAATE